VRPPKSSSEISDLEIVAENAKKRGTVLAAPREVS
jgi:hypothetical protein